jgi:hypothetical protein
MARCDPFMMITRPSPLCPTGTTGADPPWLLLSKSSQLVRILGPNDETLSSEAVERTRQFLAPRATGNVVFYVNNGPCELQLFSEPSRASKVAGSLPPYVTVGADEHVYTPANQVGDGEDLFHE